MRLYLEIQVTEPADQPYVNTILWEIPGVEEPIVLDRKTTYWSFKTVDGNTYLNMDWREVYIWDGENELPIPEEYMEDEFTLKGHLVGVELEEDDIVPETYKIVSLS